MFSYMHLSLKICTNDTKTKKRNASDGEKYEVVIYGPSYCYFIKIWNSTLNHFKQRTFPPISENGLSAAYFQTKMHIAKCNLKLIYRVYR